MTERKGDTEGIPGAGRSRTMLKQKRTGGQPIIPRVLNLLADKHWRSRAFLSNGIGRPYGLTPADINALSRMIDAGTIEFRWALTRGMSGHWEYRITAKGLEMLEEEVEGEA